MARFKTAFIFALLILSFAFTKAVFAIEQVDINNTNTPHGNSAFTAPPSTSSTSTFEYFRPNQNNITKIVLHYSSWGPNTMYLCKGLLDSSSGGQCQNDTFIASTTGYDTFIFNKTLVPFDDYYFTIKSTVPQQSLYWSVQTTDQISPFYSKDMYYYTTPSPSTETVYFKTYFETNPVFSNSIYLTQPENLKKYHDFLSWNVVYSATSSPAQISVAYWSTSASTTNAEDYQLDPPQGGDILWSIGKSEILPVGTYQARAYMFSQSGDLLSNSTTTTFSISDDADAIDLYLTGTPAATTTDDYMNCDKTTGFFENSICKIGLYLFVPNKKTVEKFTTIKDLIVTKPPIGYFTLASTKIQSLSFSTSTQNMFLGSTQFNNFFATIKINLTYFLYFALLMYLIIRVKKFL